MVFSPGPGTLALPLGEPLKIADPTLDHSLPRLLRPDKSGLAMTGEGSFLAVAIRFGILP